MPTKRLNREESQARTRELLMRSAAGCFAKFGFEGASVDAIAESAGFSRGAFYSNFADKDDLFLALLQRHLDRDLRDFQAILSGSDSYEQVVEKLSGRYRELGDNPDWCLLVVEFQLRASRADGSGNAFTKAYAEYRSAATSLLERTFSRFDKKSALTPAELAVTLTALSQGLALERAASRNALPMAVTGKAMAALLTGAGIKR